MGEVEALAMPIKFSAVYFFGKELGNGWGF